jgi:hypothetical protein
VASCQVRTRSLKATRPNSHPRAILVDTPSTADEIPSARHTWAKDLLAYLDPRDAPYASVKIFYRPRGRSFSTLSYNLANALPELLVARGVIARHNVGAGNGNREGKKRAREDAPGSSPSETKTKRRTKPTVREEVSALSQQIQALQVSGDN